MSVWTKHTTNGKRLSLFQMHPNHIRNCINLWKRNLEKGNYSRPQFVQMKIQCYSKFLENRFS
jgi:hypothetical protein